MIIPTLGRRLLRVIKDLLFRSSRIISIPRNNARMLSCVGTKGQYHCYGPFFFLPIVSARIFRFAKSFADRLHFP